MYIGTCLLEGTNVSEGRGTNNPFKLFGAPWLNSSEIIKQLEKYDFEGAKFSERVFTPTSSKYSGIKCNGIQIEIDSRDDVEPFKIGMTIINEIYKKHSDKFEFKADFFDKLYGSSDLRLAILNGDNLSQLFKKNEEAIENFNRMRSKTPILYKPLILPAIVFKNESSPSNRVAVVNFKGNRYNLEEGDVIDGGIIHKIHEDKVEYKKDEKIITLKFSDRY